MREPKVLVHRFQIVFQVGCILMAVYYTALFSTQYSDNSDAQLISIKKFNQGADNKYPTFTFCFRDTKFHWFHDTEIFNAYGLNATQYQRMLQGETAERYERNKLYRSYIKTPVFFNNGSDQSFDGFYVKITDFLHSLNFQTESSFKETRMPNPQDWNAMNEPLMHLSHHTADRICFSRKSHDTLGSVRLIDSITINRTRVQFHFKTELEVFVHFPNQLIATFENPRYLSSIGDLPFPELNYGTFKKYQTLDFKLSETKRIKKRQDSKKPCNQNIQSYDDYLNQLIGEKMMKEIGCVPIYMKMDLPNNTMIRTCVTPNDLRKAHTIFRNPKQILNENEVPCDEMLILTIETINQNPEPKPKDITIRFLYSEKVYEEIQYVKAIGFENWLSNVGGFVGIFLGYSMMQIPEFLLLFVTKFNGRNNFWTGK